MWKKIANIFTKNLGLKILSLFFAVIVWLLIVNTDDPIQSKSFTVNVKPTHTDTVTEEMGKLYEIDGDVVSVTFTVSAKRSIKDKLQTSDFKAVADFKNLVLSENGETATIPIDVTCSRYTNQVTITRPSKSMKIRLDESAESSVPVEVRCTGEPAEGCMIGELQATPNLVNISGPSSLVSTVYKAIATVNVDGRDSDVFVTSKLVFVDEKGRELQNTDKIVSEVKAVNAYAEILDYKTVSIIADYSGQPAMGYDVTGFELDTTTIDIKGRREDIKNVSAIKIPASIINIEGQTSDYVADINIKGFLPDGVSVVDADNSKISATVKISEIVQNILTVPVNQIRILGLDDNYEVHFNQNDLVVVVEGTKDKTSKIDASDLDLSISVSGKTEGNHFAEVTCRGVTGVGVTVDQVGYEIRRKNVEEPDNDITDVPVVDDPTDDVPSDDNQTSVDKSDDADLDDSELDSATEKTDAEDESAYKTE